MIGCTQMRFESALLEKIIVRAFFSARSNFFAHGVFSASFSMLVAI
jgi:hypothetical protein